MDKSIYLACFCKTSADAPLTRHAIQRMQGRAIDSEAIESVLECGRIVYCRGAVIYAVGRKEISRFRVQGIDLRHLEGVQVVCANDGTVLTVYRNRNFHWLRSGHGRGRFRPRKLRQRS